MISSNTRVEKSSKEVCEVVCISYVSNRTNYDNYVVVIWSS
jgi:hypothetical protein